MRSDEARIMPVGEETFLFSPPLDSAKLACAILVGKVSPEQMHQACKGGLTLRFRKEADDPAEPCTLEELIFYATFILLVTCGSPCDRVFTSKHKNRALKFFRFASEKAREESTALDYADLAIRFAHLTQPPIRSFEPYPEELNGPTAGAGTRALEFMRRQSEKFLLQDVQEETKQ